MIIHLDIFIFTMYVDIFCVPGSLLLGLRTTTNSGESSGREATEQQWRGKVAASQTTDLKRTSRPLASVVC